jgi:hypothetical protein
MEKKESPDLVTLEELMKQVKEIEGLRVDIKPREGQLHTLVRPYNYERLPDSATVDDLKARIDECTRPFLYNF